MFKVISPCDRSSKSSAGDFSLAGVSISPRLRELPDEKGLRLVQNLLRGRRREECFDWRCINPEEILALSNVFSFIEKLRDSFDIKTKVPIEFRIRDLYGPDGRTSAIRRVVEIDTKIFDCALSTRPVTRVIGARGVIAHELIHALGHVRVSYSRRYRCANSILEGFIPINGARKYFSCFEEYVASRAQALYYESQGYPERSTTQRMELKSHLPGDDQIQAAATRLLKRLRVVDAARIPYQVTLVEQSVRPDAWYGIVRHVMYGIAARMFPNKTKEDAVSAFDRLVFRAHALGELRALFKPMVKAIGVDALRVLRQISLGGHDTRPYLLVAALGEAIRSGRQEDYPALKLAALAQNEQKRLEQVSRFLF